MHILRTIGLVIATISLVIATAMPVNADYARGDYVGAELHSLIQGFSRDAIWGRWEVRYPSTYDGDGILAAKVRDVHTDGSCVSAVYRDGGVAFTQARSCYGWTNHLFFDQTGDSNAYVRLNRTRFSDAVIWYETTGY